jgi:hypothetical protein
VPEQRWSDLWLGPTATQWLPAMNCVPSSPTSRDSPSSTSHCRRLLSPATCNYGSEYDGSGGHTSAVVSTSLAMSNGRSCNYSWGKQPTFQPLAKPTPCSNFADLSWPYPVSVEDDEETPLYPYHATTDDKIILPEISAPIAQSRNYALQALETWENEQYYGGGRVLGAMIWATYTARNSNTDGEISTLNP